MARTKQTAKRYGKGIITWTRFYLPLGQEWPRWSVSHDDMHVGPLAGVEGFYTASLGRNVENPEQAAYIIVWRALEDLKNFQSSPACAEFLQNLPEVENSQVSIESGSSLQRLILENDPLPSLSPVASRFLTLEHIKQTPTVELEGRVAFTTYFIPRKDDSMSWNWYKDLYGELGQFPPGSDYIALNRGGRWPHRIVPFWLLTQDRWVQEKFGPSEQPQQEVQSWTIICEFRVWPPAVEDDDRPDHEMSASNPEAREWWSRAVSKAMPPVTAWEQERWDIREVPRFYPPEESDPEDREFQQDIARFREDLGRGNESAG